MKRAIFVKADDLVSLDRKTIAAKSYKKNEKNIKEIINAVSNAKFRYVVVIESSDTGVTVNATNAISASLFKNNIINADVLSMKVDQDKGSLSLSTITGIISYKETTKNDILVSHSGYLSSSDNSVFKSIGIQVK